MKNRIIVLLLTCALSVVTHVSFCQNDSTQSKAPAVVSPTQPQAPATPKKVEDKKVESKGGNEQPPVVKKYCLSKDTTIVRDNETFYLYKNSWMLFCDTTMKLFYEKNGKIDTLVFDNISTNVRGDSAVSVDTVNLVKPNFEMKFKRFTMDKTSYYDTLFITKSTEDTIFLYIPSIDEPLIILKDTVICIHSCDIKDEFFSGIIARVGDNIPIYYEPIPIDLKYQGTESKGMKPWVIILIVVIALLAVAGGGVFYWLKKKRHTATSEGTSETETQTAAEETSENTESDDIKDDTTGGKTDEDKPENVSENNKKTNEKKEETGDSKKLKKQIDGLEKQLTELQEKLDASEKQVSQLEQDHKNQISDLEKKHKENIEKEKAKKDKEFADERAKLNRRISDLQTENSTIADTVRKEMQKKVDRIEGELKQKEDTLSNTKKDLASTKEDLNTTKTKLKNEEQNVATLKEAQKQFTDKLTFTPWASDYSKKIAVLFEVADKVVKGANKLMTAGVADPYLIAKALATYEMNIGSIDMPRFSAEVFMAAGKQMAFNESGIVNLATVDEKSRPRSLRRYYLDEYLKKYINALVVLNESLAGIHRLIPDLPESATRTFGEYRSALNKCFGELEIKVISVKLFDKVTNNVDLKVTEIDYDTAIPADSILEITNCIVYAADADRPSEKIYVKSQK